MAKGRAEDNDMYISSETRQKAIHTPFTLYMHGKEAKEQALVDSGATHNFMDKSTVQGLGLGTKKLAIE